MKILHLIKESIRSSRKSTENTKITIIPGTENIKDIVRKYNQIHNFLVSLYYLDSCYYYHYHYYYYYYYYNYYHSYSYYFITIIILLSLLLK